ncbi:MAG: circularly permuted type 2 ATP-grasp protein, partial [Xanthomonadales bacterium]|nr:circularly permuted type 2 ATP-grasp protein [Xanthomonadales bacterium]
MGWPDHIRPPYALVDAWLKSLPAEQLALKRREAEVLFRRIGITFAVYTEGGDPERLIPFDLIPRVMAQAEWQSLRKGLEQRVRALNAFIHDVYHDREILKADRIPERLVLNNPQFRPEMV